MKENNAVVGRKIKCRPRSLILMQRKRITRRGSQWKMKIIQWWGGISSVVPDH